MSIRLEDKSKRKSHRISLPAKVNLDGKLYAVLDWSLEGFKADVGTGVIPDDWTGAATFILPLQQMNVSFDAVASMRRQDEHSAGFSFASLPDRSKVLLSTYIKASIEGKLGDIDGIIASVDAASSPVETQKPLTLQEQQQFQRTFLQRTIFYIIMGILALSVVGFILYTNFSKARSTRAVISGGLVDSAPELPGFLTEVKVAEGMHVRQGDLIYSLDDRTLLRTVEDMKQSFAIDKEQLEYLYVQLEEEAKSVGMYRKAATHDAERYRSSLRGLQAQIDVAQKEFHRADELVESGSISRSMWDERRKELLELEAQRDGVSQQLQLAEENVRSAKDGKFLSDGKTHGEMRELEAKIKIQQRVVEQGELQLSRALGALEQTRITSKVDGTVYAVKREAGTYVRAGESVMTIYVDDAKPWILARFTFEEAERFSPGSRALVYFPSLNEVVDGVVQALGHQAMSIGGAVSQDQEISLTEVPVKIVLLQRPSGLYPGMGASVSIDTPWLRAFKGLF